MAQNVWRILVAFGIILILAWPQDGLSQAKKKSKAKSGPAKAKAKAKAKADANNRSSPLPTDAPKGGPASAGTGASPMPVKVPNDADATSAFQLMSALSSSYRLNGNLVTNQYDGALFVRSADSSDPALREVGRRAAYTVYLHHLLQLRKPPEDLVRIASQFRGDDGVGKLAEFVKNRKLTTEEENQRNGLLLLSEIVNPSKDTGRAIFERLLKDPQERESLLMPVRLVCHRETMKLLDDVRRIANLTPAKERPDAIRASIDRSSRQLVELRFTNESRMTLHHVLVTTRLTPDPKLVGKRSDSQILTRLGFPALSGKSDQTYSAQAAQATLLEHQLAEMERGTMVFIPEVPAGARVDLPLATSDDFALLRSAEISLCSDELRIASLELGMVALPHAQRLVPDRGGNVAMNVNITRNSPVDAYDYKLGNGKFCQVFELPLEKGVTYEVSSVIPLGMDGREGYRPCHLRIENAEGEVVAIERNALVTNSGNSLTFTPTAAADYRLICTSILDESRCELRVRKISTNEDPISRSGNVPRIPKVPTRPAPQRPK